MKSLLRLLLLAFSFLLLLTAVFPCVNAVTTPTIIVSSSSADIQVRQVNHLVQIRNGGLVVINDTITLSTTAGSVQLQNFSMGFPYQYKSNLDYCFASGANSRLDVTLDVVLGKIGFYGINVTFSPPVSIRSGELYEFTVTYVFSNLFYPQMTTMSFNLTFPMYPSLVQDADACYVVVTLPRDTDYKSSSHVFTKIPMDYGQMLSHTKSPLGNFTYEIGWLSFDTTDTFLMVNVDEMKREITLDQWGNLFLSDSYQIKNKALSHLSEVTVRLPKGAYDVSVRDAFGELSASTQEGKATTYTISTIPLREGLKQDDVGKLTVAYRLPRENYVTQPSWRDFKLDFTSSEHFNWTVKKLTVTVTLPEGAEFQSSSATPQSVQKSVFQEKVTYVFYNATSFHNLNLSLTYEHLIFWASFRPTLWVGVLVAVVCAIALLWRAPKPPVPTIPIPLDDLRSFVNAYEKKTRIISELESIEREARRGKISRRLYKVRKRTLEGRLSVLSRDLAGLREKIEAAGPRFASIIRQIEVAETELEGVETDIRRVEVRYRHGEISTEAYRRLLREYHRRMDRAKTMIDEGLLRLREEIR